MADQTFGEFITSKRASFGVPLRRMAERLDITAQYLSDIEKGRRNPPEIALLEKMATEFNLNAQERILLFELAGNERDEVPPDLPEYIKTSGISTWRGSGPRILWATNIVWRGWRFLQKNGLYEALIWRKNLQIHSQNPGCRWIFT